MSDFSDLVQRHFGFLAQEHGFMTKVSSERLVIFENGSTFFQIGLGQRGEVGLVFDRCPPCTFFPFAFYLKTFYPDEAACLREHTGASKLELDVALGEWARLLKVFGGPVIAGQDKVFDSLAAKAREMLG